MTGLALDPRAVVLPGDDALHVVGRRGAHELRGTDLGRLHERLAPHLDGRLERDELLAGVPDSHTEVVALYLDRLAEAGALAEASERAPRIDFVDEAGAGRALLRLDESKPSAGSTPRTLVVRDEEPDRETLETLRDWLTETASADDRLYRLDSDELRLLATLDPEPYGPADWPDFLGVVGDADEPQLPLVVLTARHDYFDPFAAPVRRSGLDSRAVYAAALDLYLARAHLVAFSENETADDETERRFDLGPLGDLDGSGEPVTWPRERLAEIVPRLVVARSAAELEARLCDSVVAARGDAAEIHGREVNLLAPFEPPAGLADPPGKATSAETETADIETLRRLLRLRFDRLPARVSVLPEGVLAVARGDRCTVSFSVHEALAQQLALAVREAFSSTDAEPAPFVLSSTIPDPATSTRRRREALEAVRSAGRAPRMRLRRRLRLAGRTLWVGALFEDTEIPS